MQHAFTIELAELEEDGDCYETGEPGLEVNEQSLAAAAKLDNPRLWLLCRHD